MSNVTATLVPITTINDADRVRKDYGDIEALAASIRDDGLIQPIVARTRRKSRAFTNDEGNVRQWPAGQFFRQRKFLRLGVKNPAI